MLRVRARHRHLLWRWCTEWLVLLVAREAWELIADFDYTVLVGLEEEADVAVIHDGDVFVLGGFLGSELDVCVDPGLFVFEG